MNRIVLRYLKRKQAAGDFPQRQLSFKEKYRITEELDMERACAEMVNNFITFNGKSLSDYTFVFEDADPTQFDADYSWSEGIATGYIKGPDNKTYPVRINLTEDSAGDSIWTITQYERF